MAILPLGFPNKKEGSYKEKTGGDLVLALRDNRLWACGGRLGVDGGGLGFCSSGVGIPRPVSIRALLDAADLHLWNLHHHRTGRR